MFLFYCKCLSEDLTFYLPELVPYVSFQSVCLNGPVEVCLGLAWWFFFLVSVWEVSFDSCLLDQVHDVSFLQMSVLGGHFLSIWFEPYVSFLPVSCLRGSDDVCLNWSNVSFQVSVWSDQLMYVWTEPCVSFCQRLFEGFNQCLL